MSKKCEETDERYGFTRERYIAFPQVIWYFKKIPLKDKLFICCLTGCNNPNC